MSALRPGYRRIPITVVFHLYEDIPEEWEDGGRRLCHRASAFLGHLPMEEIRTKVQTAMPHEGFTPPGDG